MLALISMFRKRMGEARIADYFDVIAGTSTGGLIAAMLTTRDETGTRHPKLAAEIEAYYRTNGARKVKTSYNRTKGAVLKLQ